MFVADGDAGFRSHVVPTDGAFGSGRGQFGVGRAPSSLLLYLLRPDATRLFDVAALRARFANARSIWTVFSALVSWREVSNIWQSKRGFLFASRSVFTEFAMKVRDRACDRNDSNRKNEKPASSPFSDASPSGYTVGRVFVLCRLATWSSR